MHVEDHGKKLAYTMYISNSKYIQNNRKKLYMIPRKICELETRFNKLSQA